MTIPSALPIQNQHDSPCYWNHGFNKHFTDTEFSMTYPAIGTMAIPSALLIQNPAPPVANQKAAVVCYKLRDNLNEQQSRYRNTNTYKHASKL
jgi:hypothetical protein